MLAERGLDPDGLSDAELRQVIARLDEQAVGADDAGSTADNRGTFDPNDARILYQGVDARAWARDVDAVVRGDRVEKSMLSLGVTPPVLLEMGLPVGDLAMRKGKLALARREHPEVPLDIWRNLPALVADPRAVFPSPKADGSLIIVIDAKDADGKRIIVPVLAEPKGGSVVLSVHGRSADYIVNNLARARRDGEAIYVKEGLADALVAESDRASPPRRATIAPEVSAKPSRAILSRRDIVKKLDQAQNDGPRGRILLPAGGFGTGPSIIALFQSRNLSTVLHEAAHQWLEELRHDASLPDAPEQLRRDWQRKALRGGRASCVGNGAAGVTPPASFPAAARFPAGRWSGPSSSPRYVTGRG